jgi:integrase
MAKKHIVPALGKLPTAIVRREHVRDLHYAMRETPVQANRTLDLLSRMLNMAESWGLMPEGSNPCRGTTKYRQQPRERFLTAAEFRKLGRALDEAEADGAVSVHAAAAIRLLMLTGCRKNEIVTLRWKDVDLEALELNLADTKTGSRIVPLAPAAVRVLAALPRDSDNPWVIAGKKAGSHLTDLQHPWRRIRARAGLDGVRIHDLRHSFASRAVALGESLPMIGKLLGHTQVQTTARYAHLAHDTVKASASRVAESIGDALASARQ